jgi:hypothetical protein
MLIVATQDVVIRATAQDPGSGAAAWGATVLLPIGGQGGADAAFAAALAQLNPMGEPLCLSAHGNDEEIGDADAPGWGWDSADIANLLVANAPGGWLGPVLIHACAEQVSNFSAHLAVALDEAQAFNQMWCYGYNRPVPDNSGFPDPGTLGNQVDLQGTQVNF